MSRVQRWIVTAAAIVVLLGAALWAYSAVQTANSPEEKCKRVMADVERERGQPIDPAIWLSTYNDCVERERTGANKSIPANATPEQFCQAVAEQLGGSYTPSQRQTAYDDCLNRRRASG